MTKCCEACHTVNRDRAQYCRGCAGRFTNLGSASLRSGVSVPGTAAAMSGGAAAAMAAMPRPAPPFSPKLGFSLAARQEVSLMSLLFPAAAVLMASLVVWQQWSRAGEVRSAAKRGAPPVQMQTAARPASTPDALALVPAGASLGSRESLVDASSEPDTVPQESLLALTMEHSAKALSASESTPAGTPRILGAEPAQASAADQRPSATGTESDMGIASDVTVNSVTATERPAASRQAVASARPSQRAGSSRSFYGPTTVALQPMPAQGITGPCNRYNPFGEVTCASVPGRGAHAGVSYRTARSSASSR